MAIFGEGLDYAAEAAKNEKQRQSIINLGLDQINAIFGGGTVPFYSPVTSKFSPTAWQGGGKGQNYYTLGKKGGFVPYYAGGNGVGKGQRFLRNTGEVFTPSGMLDQLTNKRWTDSFDNGDWLGIATGGLFGFGKDKLTPRERVNKMIGSNRVFTSAGEQTFEGFTPEFYKEREKAYLDYAMPQLGEQYRTNRDAILYGLANRGLLGGSVQTKASSDLERTTGRAKQSIADTAIGQSQQLERDVERARQDAIAKLYTSGKPSEAISSAISSAGGFRTPSTFAPVVDMFENLAKQYYTNLLYNNYRPGAGGSMYGAEDFSLPSSPISFGN